MSENHELDLADDYEWAHNYWLSWQKGSEVNVKEEPVKEDKPTTDDSVDQEKPGEELDAEQHTGNESEMAARQSDQDGSSNEPSGRGVDGDGGDGNTRRSEDENSSTSTVAVTTVRPTSDTTAPTKPEYDNRDTFKRRGPKFKNHSRRRN